MWKLDNPIQISDASNNNCDLSPVYDGKNLWVLQQDGSVQVVEFWGPYADLPNDSSNIRYQAAEVDYLNLGAIGPASRVIKTRHTGLFNINGFCYYENYVYAMGAGGQIVRAPVDFSSDFTAFFTTIPNNSDMVIANRNIYFVNVCPTTQTLPDYQTLNWVNIDSLPASGSVTGTTSIASKKQTSKRYLALSSNFIYVSSFNTMSVIKFNALTGAYVSTITVNRDVSRLFRFDNDIYVISSVKGTSTIGAKSFPTSMVSKIDQTDTVTTMYGIIHNITGDSTQPVHIANDTNYVWMNNDSGGIQRTTKSNLATILTDNTIIGGGDYNISNQSLGVSVSGNTASVTQISVQEIDNVATTDSLTVDFTTPSSLAHKPASNLSVTRGTTTLALGTDYTADLYNGKITFISTSQLNQGDAVSASYVYAGTPVTPGCVWISPPTTYTWFDGTNWNPISVPSYLFIMSNTQLISVMLPSAIKWESSLTLNQYTAVSTGGGYKAG